MGKLIGETLGLIVTIVVIIGFIMLLNNNEIKELQQSSCEHEWEYVGHRYNTTAICNKCNLEVSVSNLKKYEKED